MICGASGGSFSSYGWSSFPYRSSSLLTEFFIKCDLEYVHDGSTRKQWVLGVLEQLNRVTPTVDALPSADLLRVIQELFDPSEFKGKGGDREAALRDLNGALARDGLEAYFNGPWQCLVRPLAIEGRAGAPSRSLRQIIRERDIGSLDDEFKRALDAVDSDPPAAATAACASLEAVFKVYVEDYQLPQPTKETVKPLWKLVSKHLGFDPARIEDDDLKRILSGLSSVVDGIAALRTHAGSAHGQGTMRYRLKPRHARLAVHSAHTLAAFVVESWDERNEVT